MENDLETSSSSNENAQVSEDCELSDSFEMKEIKPFVGMIFSSSEAAKDFYNGYAKQKGFGTGINKSWCNKKTNIKNLLKPEIYLKVGWALWISSSSRTIGFKC